MPEVDGVRQSISPPRSRDSGECRHLVKWEVEDPSEFRPEMKKELEKLGKDSTQFRVYDENNKRFETVRRTYEEMHTKQTLDFVKEMREKYQKLDHCQMTIMEAVKRLDLLVDESDPDTALPNSVHAFQTAERIREAHPNEDWFHLVGLIHDLGKVLALLEDPLPQFAVVGDTFPVGCAFSDKCVFPEFFERNPDSSHPVYSTKYGTYEPNCGLENVYISYGHDEYMYQVLVGNGCKLPEQALYMVRFHSLYPWHEGGAYDHLCTDKDRRMMEWVREFNKFDLYSKADQNPNVEELAPYYQSLIDKYIPTKVLRW